MRCDSMALQQFNPGFIEPFSPDSFLGHLQHPEIV